MAFPIDDYTPHGYLDVPGHARRLSPLGVLRSHGAGLRWHFPAFAGMYGGRRETYRAGMRVAIDGALDLRDFDRAACPYHSKNQLTFDLARGAARAEVAYHAVGHHALRALIAVGRAARVAIHAGYERLLAASGEWGESGLVGRVEDGLLVLHGFEDGDAFVLWASRPWSDLGVTASPAEAAIWAARAAPGLPADGFVTALGGRGETVELYAVLGFDITEGVLRSTENTDQAVWLDPDSSPASALSVADRLEVVLARGRTVGEARRRLEQARRDAEAERARLLAEDDAFWSRAPRLEGDWPDHWRRGLVYDLETLRMMVKPPLGIYRHAWDAMQIHAPRAVLAETAIDALLLAYADPALAQALMLGAFLDAPAPNVPCTREDGSYNMVAADGTVCGTAPAWGFPWLVLGWLERLRPDRDWLAAIYPRLAAYLDWWLDHRRDSDGWLVYACSWESGQDDSPRFGAQPLGGGHPVRHVRPVDLQAAFAHAARIMARFAAALDLPEDAGRWDTLAQEFAGRTSGLWLAGQRSTINEFSDVRPSSFVVGRYADFDARAGRLTEVDDLMLLTPAALGLASDAQLAALRPRIEAIDPAELTWPMLAWTAVEAALAAGLGERAAGLAAAVCERAYGFWDARAAAPDRTLPGIACEYWPTHGRCGGEGYGWGAFTAHLLLHGLLGLEPGDGMLIVCPRLPPAWRVPGRRYGVGLEWRGRRVGIVVEPLDAKRAAVEFDGRRAEVAWGEALSWSVEA